MIDSSNFAHAFLAVCAQLVIAIILFILGLTDPLTGLVIGGFFSVGFYLGREVDQVEKKYHRTPWYVGFDLRYWTVDGKLDFIFPLVACVLVALIGMLYVYNIR